MIRNCVYVGTVIGHTMAFAICFLLLVLIHTNQVLGYENSNSARDNDGSMKDILTSQQKQIDFLVQQVSELSKVSKNQRIEIDELKNVNRNLLLTISDLKRSHVSIQHQWSVRLDEETIDKMAERDDQSVIRKERLLLPNPQTTHVPKTNVVAFYAYMSQDFPNPGASHTLVFDTVVTNVGNGYHSTTGVFLAPETGVYVFSWSMRLFNGEYHRAELIHNYQVMGVAYLYAPTGDHTVSETIVIQVNQGDDVYLRTQVGDNNGDIESGSGGRSIFSGWKLN